MGDIMKFMKNVLANYERNRGRKRSEENLFWDIVVITALDEDQRKSYQLQMYEKKKNGEVPLGVDYIVLCDPPEWKIGCGGSAMFVAHYLSESYKRELLMQKRILFIPAGGFSQRLPNWSVLGKLFCPIPYVGIKVYHMIDLIFAVYLPFMERMPPGIFIASSDVIISYCLSDIDTWTFHNSGFTAVAHLSPLSVAKNHGVYVLHNTSDRPESAYMETCKSVLQKPSEQVMREKCAVVHRISPLNGNKMEFAYTDSVFFYETDVMFLLADLYAELKPIRVEVNSYRDFLFPLATSSDVRDLKLVDPELLIIQYELFRVLRGTPFSILVLNESAFHHFGTMAEYAEHLSPKSLFFKHFPLQNCASSTFTLGRHHLLNEPKGTVMHSFLHYSSEIHIGAVVEFCDFCAPICVKAKSIVSNCTLHLECMSPEVMSSVLPIVVPPNVLIHTITLNEGFVTVCFGIDDNIKNEIPIAGAGDLVFLNKKFGTLMDHFVDCVWFEENSVSVSMWQAKLFTVQKSRDESFLHTYKLINLVLNNGSSSFFNASKSSHVSMQDIMLLKNTEVMLDHMKHLLLRLKPT